MKEIHTALITAKSKGINYPKLRIDNFIFSLAPFNGRNAGSIYVKTKDGIYRGKITSNVFYPFDCSTQMQTELQLIASNLAGNIVAHGRKTGICSCCGRSLVEAVSVASGIGPICADNFGLTELREELAVQAGCFKNVDTKDIEF